MEFPEEVLSIEVRFRWNPVLVDNAYFPWHRTVPNAFQRPAIEGPKVYRWVLRASTSEVSQVYIGETDDFERRLRAYRFNAGSKTESYIQLAFRSCEASGGKVELQFLEFESDQLRINGTESGNPTLSDHGARLMMEGIALVVASRSQVKVLNKLRKNAYVNKFDRLWDKYPHKRAAFLALLQSRLNIEGS